VLILDNASGNIYKRSAAYTKIATEMRVEYRGKIYHKKITYEKKLNTLHRLAVGLLAFLEILAIVPFFFHSKQVSLWWKQAFSGIDRRVVLIKESSYETKVQTARDQHLFGVDSGVISQEKSAPFSRKPAKATKSQSQPRIRRPLLIKDQGPLLFSDSDIVENLEFQKTKRIGSKLYANFTAYKKAIIQQVQADGSTAASAAMLIMDNRKKPIRNEIVNRASGDIEDVLMDIEKAGLGSLVSEIKDDEARTEQLKGLVAQSNSSFVDVDNEQEDRLSELRAFLVKSGSAIVTVNKTVKNHFIVVDEISKDLSKVRLRDPYHGWEITVTSKAFLSQWKGGVVIQAIDNIPRSCCLTC
jgi:hypothetical protein